MSRTRWYERSLMSVAILTLLSGSVAVEAGIGPAPPATNVTRYVNTCGLNTNTGTSPDCFAGENGPFRSIQYAVEEPAADNVIKVVLAAGVEFDEDVTIVVPPDKAVVIEGNGATILFTNVDAPAFDIRGQFQGQSWFQDLTIRAANHSGDGGAILLDVGASLTLCDVTLTNNTAARGGGVFVGDNSHLELNDCRFNSNGATGNGGGIYLSPTATTSDTAQNVFSFNTSQARGGAIYAAGGNPEFTFMLFDQNHADFTGGAISIQSGQSAKITDCTMTGNSADFTGGGAVGYEGNLLDISGCTFSGNSGPQGGAVLISGGASGHTIVDSDFNGNTGGNGGGLWIFGTTIVDVSQGCTFTTNHADLYGGAVYVGQSVILQASGITFSQNDATVGGGAVGAQNSNVVNIWGCDFTGNDGGSTGGGAVFSEGVNILAVSRSYFNGNNGLQGGGVLVSGGAGGLIQNSVFDGNTATWGGGFWMFAGSEDFSLTNCTFVQNAAILGDAAYNIGNSSSTYANCIFWDNDTGAPVAQSGDSTQVINFSDVEGGWAGTGTGNINIDPMFEIDGIRLAEESPCLDTGDNNVTVGNIDLDASARRTLNTCTGNTVDSPIDMGAFERASDYLPPPARIYVDAGGTSCAGATWGEAMPDLRFALALAQDYPGTVTEIWAKTGTYLPDSGTSDRGRTFLANLNVSLYGGFAGSETSIDQRNPSIRSILSGDIGVPGDTSDNSYNVVRSTQNTPLFDGFEISGGRADVILVGGGVYVDGILPASFVNCKVHDNYAADRGGGAFAANAVSFTDCVFMANTSGNKGGGVYLAGASQLSRCTIYSNNAVRGGGVYMAGDSSAMQNCIVRNNDATVRGGGVLVEKGAVINCTVSQNDAPNAAGMYLDQTGAFSILNTIIWGNGASNVDIALNSVAAVRNCDIEGEWPPAGCQPCENNIDKDPRFIDVTSNDFTPDPFSPCLDAGDNSAQPGDFIMSNGLFDVVGNPRYRDGLCGVDSSLLDEFSDLIIAGTIDIGAVEAPSFVIRETDFDCNANDFPDSCDADIIREALLPLTDPVLSKDFRNLFPTYQSILAAYGLPWEPNTGQDPAASDPMPPYDDQPARILLEVALNNLCDPYSDDLLTETADMFMLYGNEAFADALDPTVGTFGLDLALLGDYFAFEGVPGINSLLDEELALLRGREISTDFSNVTEPNNYPDCGDGTRAAIYNRLPSNTNELAYRSTYDGISDVCDAAAVFPQGHGDAYGYYLLAVKAYVQSFHDPSTSSYLAARQPNEIESVTTNGFQSVTSVGYQSVRGMAETMAARARAASQIVERTFRRDYVENAVNPGAETAEYDPLDAGSSASQRAWKMADWASRAALGAYCDWALVNHLVPERDPALPEGEGFSLTDVNRQNLEQVSQLVGAVAEMQVRVDWAASGRNPLGLVENVVPFGIDSGELLAFIDGSGGMSHYEQVREPADKSLMNASVVLEWANQAQQRMRGSAEEQVDFEAWVTEQAIDYDNELIELYGLPSPSDLIDNDLDGLTEADGDDESQSPDLVRFLLTNEDLADIGAAPRAAPGEIQLALSEVRIAQLRSEQAHAQLTVLNGDIKQLYGDIQARRLNNEKAVRVVYDAGQREIAAEDRLEAIDDAEAESDSLLSGLGILGDVIGAAADCFGESGPTCAGKLITTAASAAIDAYSDEIAGFIDPERVDAEPPDNEFNVARERVNIQTMQDAALLGIEGDNAVMDLKRELEGLLRRSPQAMLEIATAREGLAAAIGRVSAAIKRGERLQADRERLRRLARDQLEEYRYHDLAFRVFRNDALQKYRGFFDVAARYVMLAARSYAYEYNRRDVVDVLLGALHRDTRLGRLQGEGLWSIIGDLDSDFDAQNIGGLFWQFPQDRQFSLRKNLLGLPTDTPNPDVNSNGDLAFRAWLESSIVQRLEAVPEVARFVDLDIADTGPAIVMKIGTNIGSPVNFFGQPISAEFGNSQFNSSLRTHLMYEYQLHFENVEFGALPNNPEGIVNVWVIPAGASMFREPVGPIADAVVRPWSVVNQNLRSLLTISSGGAWESDANYSAWVDLANGSGDFFNDIQPLNRSEGWVPGWMGSSAIVNEDRVGRTAWNTNWVIAVPGGQWAPSDPDGALLALLTFIYGGDGGVPASPELNRGITDIKWIIKAYSRQQ